MEACVHGVSTRKVDDLVTALGIEAGASKGEVRRICAELDTVRPRSSGASSGTGPSPGWLAERSRSC